MSQVDISGLDKVSLLERLWSYQLASLVRFYEFHGLPLPVFDRAAAVDAVKAGNIYYFCGCCIMVDLSKDVVDPLFYDMYAGLGKFSEIVAEMRAAKK